MILFQDDNIEEVGVVYGGDDDANDNVGDEGECYL